MLDFTLSLVLQGAALLGMLAGMTGVFALLRQQSLLGDAISHAALPGIVLMFLCTESKNPWVLLCGGALAGSCSTLLVQCILVHTKLKKDAVLGIILSVFFGLGLVLLTVAQKYECASQAILNKFLFGSIATLLPIDVFIIKVIALCILCIFCVCWKQLSLYTFDPVLSHLSGFSTRLLEIIITTLFIITIVIGLQSVGVVLMSTLLIAPAAAARQWTHRLEHMFVLAGLFGACAAISGVYVSNCVEHLPTGPTIVMIASCIVFMSLLFSPQRSKM